MVRVLGVLGAVVDGGVGDDGGGLVVVVAAGVEVAVEAGEVGAGDLDADSVAGVEVVAGVHWGEGDLVDLVFFHPDGFVVAFTVAEALDGLVEVVGRAVGEDVDDFDGDVGVLDVGGDVEGCGDGAADLDSFLQRLGGVDEDVGGALPSCAGRGLRRCRGWCWQRSRRCPP